MISKLWRKICRYFNWEDLRPLSREIAYELWREMEPEVKKHSGEHVLTDDEFVGRMRFAAMWVIRQASPTWPRRYRKNGALKILVAERLIEMAVNHKYALRRMGIE